MHSFRRPLPLAAAIALALAVTPLAASVVAPTPLHAAPESSRDAPHATLSPDISPDQWATRAAYLASDDLQGRESGTPGGDAAEEYVAAEFARFGLLPCGEKGTGFQSAPMPWRPVLAGTSWLEIRRDGEETRRFTPFDGAVPFSTSKPGDVEAGVVFAGFGLTSPADGYDDWAGLDATGKVALVLRHGPRVDQKESPWYLRKADGARMEQMSFATKAKLAAKAGAVGVIFVNHQHLKDQGLPTTSPGEEMPIPAIALPRDAVNRILRAVGKELVDFEKGIDRDLTPRSCDVPGVTIALRASLGTASGRNVLYRLPGSDPALAKETVVVSAHMDHVGLGWFGSTGGAGSHGQVHNGADDNASGTAAMLEIAEALSAGPAPKRSVLFAGWCGEEKGLIGSAYWCARPTVPLADVVANVNLDMVGRYRDGGEDDLGLGCAGATTGSGFLEKVDELAKTHALRVSHTWDAWEQSDHFSFYLKKVPVMFLHTGLHPDYHRPGDDWWKLDSKGGAKVARLAADLVRRIADDPARPAFRERPKRAMLGANLGDADDGGGATLGAIVPGMAAATAGLRTGDVVVEADGKKIRKAPDLSKVITSHTPGDVIDVVVKRGSERLTVKVTLTAPPERNAPPVKPAK